MQLPISLARTTIIGFLALALAMGIGRFAFTPLLPMMQRDGLLDVAGGGLLASMHFLGYLAGALIVGRLPVAPRPTLLACVSAIAVTTLGMGLTGNFALWLTFRAVSGICSAIVLVVISDSPVRQLTEAGRAELHGWIFSGVGAGIVVAGLAVLALMAGQVGSAASWQLLGVLALLCCLALAVLTGGKLPEASHAAAHHAVATVPMAWPVVVAYGAAGMGYIIPATFLPVMARETVSSSLVFGWSWPVFGLAAWSSTLLAARLQARASNRRLWSVSQIVMGAGLLLPACYPHISTVIVAAVCVGGTFMIITMAGMKEAHRIAAGDVQRHIAALTTAFAAGQIAGPVAAGWAHRVTGNFTIPLLATSVMLFITAVPLARSTPRKELARV